MRPWTLKTQALAAALIVGVLTAPPAYAAMCLFGGCDVGEKAAKAVLENLLKQRFDKPGQILDFKTTMTERLERAERWTIAELAKEVPGLLGSDG